MSTSVTSMNNKFQLLSSSSSCIKVEEEAPKMIAMEKQGIVSILGSDCETTKAAASLRRTLSADMSSKKWLAQNGFNSFSPMKKIASSEELAIHSAPDHHSLSSSFSSISSEGEDDHEELIKGPGQDDVWRSIQTQKDQKKEQPDVWSWASILAQKNEDSSNLPPPYIHPMVRRSGSSLSEKSLEICTESLGSETGCDVFSSYPPSEIGEADEEKENNHQSESQTQPQLSRSNEDMRTVKYNYSTTSRKIAPRSFPPPLPSLPREDRVSVHMQSYRENGRLVVEAVSVPPQNYFQAQRQDGRLRLTFINTPSPQDEEMEDDVQGFDQVFDNFEEIENHEAKFDYQGDKGYEEDEEEEEEDEEEEGIEEQIKEDFEGQKGRREVEFVMEQNSKLPSGWIDVHKPTLMVKKLMGLDKRNLAWATRFNKAVNLIGVEEVVVEDELIPQSLPVPPPPRVARLISAPPATTTAAASFNAYEYFWKEKSTMTMASIIKPITTEQACQPLKNNQNNKVILASNSNLKKGYEQQNLVFMRGNKTEYLVPFFRRCKEPRARSLLLWEPYCIATS